MKPPSIAPSFCGLYLILAEAARSCGYALCVHGTMARDLDLVAVPWTDEALPAADLVERLREVVGHAIDPLNQVIGPREKPHGRLAWFLTLYPSGAGIDLSVMPVAERVNDAPAVDLAELKRCPFCGSGARVVRLGGAASISGVSLPASYSVVCNQHCYTLGGASSHEGAVKAWNDLCERRG